jgi:hypothetical protein
MFVGSGGGPNGQGDNIRFELVCDDNWNLVIVDLSQATAVVDGVVNYLRWDPFAGGSDATIDLGYIALFNTAEAALAYDAQFANVYRNVPYHNDVAVDLGVRTSGGPFSTQKTFGQKLPLGETFLKQITINNMATYADGNTNTWALKIWAWNTDYATTVAGTPLYVLNGENHQDNQDFIVDIPVKLLISGDVYYELEYLTGSAQFTGWAADAILVEGVQTYVAGELAEGTYASAVVVGVEAEPPVEKPENGSLELPLTVGETLTAVEGLESGAATEVQYYTTGVVTEIGQGGSYYKNVYFTDGENTMLIYTLNPMEGMGTLRVGDTITVYGYIKNYNGTIEFASKYVDDAQVYVYIVAHEAAPIETLVVNMDNEANASFKRDTAQAVFGFEGNFWQLGYNNQLTLGTIDLSLYSKAEIVYSHGAPEDVFNATPSHAIGFKSSATAYGWATNEPNFTDDIAHADMTWDGNGNSAAGMKTAVLDLTEVDYNGEVFLCVYNPAGTVIPVISITLIP